MKFISLFAITICFTLSAQLGEVNAIVVDAYSLQPIEQAQAELQNAKTISLSDAFGQVTFKGLQYGKDVIEFKAEGYSTQLLKFNLEGSSLDLGQILLFPGASEELDDGWDFSRITLSDDELNDDTSAADNVSGLIQSSMDVFNRAAAFEFSSSFFKIRGLDSENGKVLINGISMNKMFNGRPQWSNWGGINDVTRNQEYSNGISASDYTFGGMLGSSNINTRASSYRRGGRITYSSSNRSYSNRVLASYASGTNADGWAYALAVGSRWGKEGYQDASFYEAQSFFLSIEKNLGENHSLNFTAIYTPNSRGKSSPNTQEVYDLRDIRYNEYWGWQEGKKRNSRVKRVEEPIFMLNHYWDVSPKISLNTNIAYQFGELGNSRLDYAGGKNPSPAYYQNLPSYFLADDDGPDYEKVYKYQQQFIQNGQIDWNRIYDANINNANEGLSAAYVLYEDRSDDKQFTFNTIIDSRINEHLQLNGSLTYQKLKSHNFAEILDLLGGSYYLNQDSFGAPQSYNLNEPNLRVGEGDTFRYNYNMLATASELFFQTKFTYNAIDFFTAITVGETTYQREGLYRNEAFLDNSFGKSKKLNFTTLGIKAGATIKLTGRHLIDIHGAYLQKPPSLRNTFSNSRENNVVVGDFVDSALSEEVVTSADISYLYRSSLANIRLTTFYTQIEDVNEISFFYADGIGGDNTAFVQEVLQGINKQHIGVELGGELQVIPSVKFKAAASVGEYIYSNNPEIYFTSSDFETGFVGFETTKLENYKLAGGPQRAYSLGFEYRDPKFWWFGATTNFFSNTYLDVSPITRSSNFYLDDDGLPFQDYDPDIARELLPQEKFNDYMVVNLVGGKSWKINDYYIGLFVSINNLLGETYKTGGFEQGRNANFRQLGEDTSLSTRVFGPKYWYGRGTTYFINLNVRF